MSQQSENQPELIRYRFIDDSETEETAEDAGLAAWVEYYPSIEDFVSISEKNAKQFKLRSYTKIGLQAFFIVNTIVLPAILLYSNLIPAALLAFGLNMLFCGVALPELLRADYRRHYKALFPNLENQVVRIELSSSGVASQNQSDSSFYSWKNFISIEETKDAIFLHMTGGRGIPVRKSGFAYEDQMKEFMALARYRIEKKQLQHDSRNS